MALWRKHKVYGIGAKEKSQGKCREKLQLTGGLTFTGAAGSAGPGEAILHHLETPSSHWWEPTWETVESQNPQAPWPLLTELPRKRHQMPVEFCISCSLSCAIKGHLIMYSSRGNTQCLLEYFSSQSDILSNKGSSLTLSLVFSLITLLFVSNTVQII